MAQQMFLSFFVPATVTILLGANPAQVNREGLPKDIRSLSSQSERFQRDSLF